MIDAYLEGVDYHLPDGRLTNADLARDFPDWEIDKVYEKTGIASRRVAAPDESAADLAVHAARRLLDRLGVRPVDVDFLLFCTQTPDYFLPTTACLLQDRLGLPTSAGALDFNLGCSGFVYGLSLAKGLIETAQATNVLLLTADTYSKFLHPDDRSVRTLFGDAAAATLVQVRTDASVGGAGIGPFVFGTDGQGKDNLIVATGGMRQPVPAPGSSQHLAMNGPEIFTFTLQAVPRAIEELLARAGKTI